uniref:Uncharacterized protein n=1 Tax=Oryza punctata TaxID=4537 RepID=A0A0E0KNM6_ORYPU
MRARLDGLKNRLRAKDDELGRKSLEMEGLARSFREAKAENKRLQAELDAGSMAKAKIDRLKAEQAKERGHSAVLTDYYNMTEPQMEALRQEVGRREAKAQRLAREAARMAASAKTACRTLRLALNDMGAKARGVLGENASVLEFCEWNQEAGCAVSNCAAAYGDCCARVSAAFALGLLQQHRCEHVAQFPTLRRGTGKQRRRIKAKNPQKRAEVEPKATQRCEALRPKNEKFTAVKNLPKARYLLRPVYCEMTINGHNYKVVNVANWMRTHPGRTLEDYDRVHVARLEGMARFWRNHRRTNRQEAIAQRRYSLSLCGCQNGKLRRRHPGRTLEDYDRCHIQRREDIATLWLDFEMTNSQAAIA